MSTEVQCTKQSMSEGIDRKDCPSIKSICYIVLFSIATPGYRLQTAGSMIDWVTNTWDTAQASIVRPSALVGLLLQ